MRTSDSHWRESGATNPYRPFPDKPYFRAVLDEIQREPVLFIEKSRDMMIAGNGDCVLKLLTHEEAALSQTAGRPFLLAKKCAVKGAGLQRVQLPPGNWLAPPVAIETAAEATKLSELSMERVAWRLRERNRP